MVQIDDLTVPHVTPIMTRIRQKEQKRKAIQVKDGFAQRGFNVLCKDSMGVCLCEWSWGVLRDYRPENTAA